ncbi:MAG: TIGR00159 family protein [Planctomycetes bacterium]|nr:TIGR00159 family protein [Planctomycetota bacterium]
MRGSDPGKGFASVDTFVDYLNRIAQNQWWIVAIELFSIGLVVWWVVNFLEGTRGERLFRGVIFILVAGVLILNLVVERLPFDRLQYLYKGFLIAILIVAVAGFQPEIRRVLIQIGQPRIWTSSSHQLSRTVEELVTAVTELSAARIGAIVVIERQVALGEFIETGVRLDARVTADLLKTIFYPGTPLHDMAVVVRGDRLVAARVQLPLAEAGSVSGVELGSRHRAAVGITVGSDALCLVVSEETGAISVARNGELHRNLTESQVRSSLTRTATGHAALMGRWLKRPAAWADEELRYK